MTITLFQENFDGVTAPVLPTGWSVSHTGSGSDWGTTAVMGSVSAPNCARVAEANGVGDYLLESPVIAFPAMTVATLSFANQYGLAVAGAKKFNGGVLEAKIGNSNWTDVLALGCTFTSHGYGTTSIAPGTANPLSGRHGFVGGTGGFVMTQLDLSSAFFNQPVVQFRWRLGTVANWTVDGWYIDDVLIEYQE